MHNEMQAVTVHQNCRMYRNKRYLSTYRIILLQLIVLLWRKVNVITSNYL
jgi:hypothetical protein